MQKQIFKNLLIISILALLISQSAFAQKARYNSSCRYSPDGLHAACVEGGTAKVLDCNTKKLIFVGQLYKCKYCNDLIVTEGQPHLDIKIYRYVTIFEDYYYTSGSGDFRVDPSNIEECKSVHLDGYNFYD